MELQCWAAAHIEAVHMSAIPYEHATPYGEPPTVTHTSARVYGTLGSSLILDPPLALFFKAF